MNRKMVFYMIGKIVQAEAAMLLLPLVVALLYKETPLPFLITIGIALVLGIALSLIFKPKDRVIYAKEGFVIVAFAWIALSLIGCIPFVLSGALPNFFDAFFDSQRLHHHRRVGNDRCGIHAPRGADVAQLYPLGRWYGCSGLYYGHHPLGYGPLHSHPARGNARSHCGQAGTPRQADRADSLFDLCFSHRSGSHLTGMRQNAAV